jgi:hypothetical protein
LIGRQAVRQGDQVVKLPSSQHPADEGVLVHAVGLRGRGRGVFPSSSLRGWARRIKGLDEAD